MVSIIETESNNNNFNNNNNNNNNINNNNQPNLQHIQQQQQLNTNNIMSSSEDRNMPTQQQQQQQSRKETGSAVSQRSIEIEITPKSIDNELAKRALKLDLVNSKNIDNNYTIKSPKSPLSITGDVRGGRLSHQTSISSQVEAVEDRKTLRDALYQGIFHRHRKTIFAMGSFLRMLRSRNSQYNTIRSTDGEDVDESR